MDIIEKYKKSTLESALNEFGEKYTKFCNDHICATCALSPSDNCFILDWMPERMKACKAYVIDHLTEANRKMDEAIAKEKEAKRKKDEYAEKLLFAIKAEKRDLEYRNRRDADYIILNPDDRALLESYAGECLALHLSGCSIASYTTIYGMKIVCDISVGRGEFVIGFKTDSHSKEATE